MQKRITKTCQLLIVRLIAALVLWPMSIQAQTRSPSEQRGFRLAVTYCAQCHAIDRLSESPLKVAPPFRKLHHKYPVETLEEALAEGIVTGHPTMPEFRLAPDQITDFIAFLKTLER
jgi:mono/diheme cytochrome c family protein